MMSLANFSGILVEEGVWIGKYQIMPARINNGQAVPLTRQLKKKWLL